MRRVRLPLLLLLVLSCGLVQTNATSRQATIEPAAYVPLVVAPPIIPTPTPPPAATWLDYLNAIRELGGLSRVSENTTWSNGAVQHAIYMVKTDTIGHSEDSSSPYYTLEGHLAAQNSNVMVSGSINTSDNDAIDLWILGPFHGVGVIDPFLRQIGFGSYREEDGGWEMGAALDVLRGRVFSSGISYPIRWPDDGQTSWYSSYGGGEYPDPIAGCSGYSTPTGAPIYLLLGSGSVNPVVTASSLSRDSSTLEHCVYTETTYTDPSDSSATSLGRQVLGARDAVVIMPRQPLSNGTYSVSITANGNTYSWSFSVDTSAAPTTAAIEQLPQMPQMVGAPVVP
jgi:uncharacterized protein YkwD